MSSNHPPMPTIRQCLADPRLPRLELRMLLEQVLQQPRVWLLAHDDVALNPTQFDAYVALRERRLAGEPMAYLLGRREFLDFVVKVAPGVLIPRPETELLVQCAQALLSDIECPRILDLGTGSGVVALAMARACPDAEVVATDCSAVALQMAQDNANALGLHARLQFLLGSWYQPLAEHMVFDLIVSNPPYIQVNDVHLTQGDLRFEPRGALTDGHDGLADIRQIVAGSPARLKPGGHLCLEHGFDQGAAVRDLLQRQGFVQIETLLDLSGHERVTRGILHATVV